MEQLSVDALGLGRGGGGGLEGLQLCVRVSRGRLWPVGHVSQLLKFSVVSYVSPGCSAALTHNQVPAEL